MFHTWDIDGMMEGMGADQMAYWAARFRIKEDRETKDRMAREAVAAADKSVRTPRKR